jgi:hypothetical protein
MAASSPTPSTAEGRAGEVLANQVEFVHVDRFRVWMQKHPP